MLRSFVLVLILLASISLHAKEMIFDCQTSKVKIDMPDNVFKWIYVSGNDGHKDKRCTFWKDRENIEYSTDPQFGGSAVISKAYPFQINAFNIKFGNASSPADGTWSNFLNKKEILNISTSEKKVRIVIAYYREKYLAKISPEEEQEIIRETSLIIGKFWKNGVLVGLSVTLPYKSLTEAEVINMMKSVEVIQGFDASETVKK